MEREIVMERKYIIVTAKTFADGTEFYHSTLLTDKEKEVRASENKRDGDLLFIIPIGLN